VPIVDMSQDGACCLPDEQVRQVLESRDMKITYDRHTDTLSVILKDDVVVAESDEDKPGVILDYDECGDFVSLEILDASRRVTDGARIEYQTTG
jgi:uncharacterized protein YuzE